MKSLIHCVIIFLAGSLAAEDPTPTPTPAKAEPAATPEPTPQPTRRQMVDGLSDEDVQKALKAVEGSFLDGSVANEAGLRRAALEGLLIRQGAGLAIVSGDGAAGGTPPFPYLSEILDAHIGYIRPGALDSNALSQLDSTLKSFPEKGVDALILDLRGVTTAGDLETTAEFARRLSPRGKLLFTLQKPSAKQERIFTSNQDPVFVGQMIVLTDSRTSGGAEALAATLRSNAGAMIIGSDSAGAALEYQVVPLAGASLKVAVAQVLLPKGGTLFPGGVKPDIAISLPADVQEQIFRESTEKGISQFVFETEKRRMNEASLVANTNPEIDGVQSMQKSRAMTPPKDTVLQRAVDLVTAIQFYSKKQSNP
jgi:hypothetical protein